MAQVRVEQKLWSGPNSPYGSQGSLAELENWWSPSSYGIQIGIQAPKDSKFFLNYDEHPIIVGETGIFEWNTEGHGYIKSICYQQGDQVLNDDDYIMINLAYEI